MPVFVEWKWIEKTKTLLTIFHFYDDFSKANLRFVKLGDDIDTLLYSLKRHSPLQKSWMTWAPSHLEMALLMELLGYANIINGLKPSEKKKILVELEGKEEFFYSYHWRKRLSEEEIFNELFKIGVPKTIIDKLGTKVLLYADLREEYPPPIYTCVELCPEYIDYLKRILKPYLKE